MNSMMMGLRVKKYKTRQAPHDWGRSIIREAARQWGHREACRLSHCHVGHATEGTEDALSTLCSQETHTLH